ncbi:MAG: hypothetical protein EZS28_012806 [Streblomastix strix]|uniref:Tail fiber protein n=1 Tax=Streblomastix strix TaxID=222440 RepID=A0A5J4W9R3_9EUKA|nr:MAG: hypothetical protein EZS28_012806 [Streblomastix strix]
MCDQNWYNIGNIVPDQVTPARYATPLVDSGTAVAGTSTEYSRRDHQHPLQVSSVLPLSDTATGEVVTAATYSRQWNRNRKHIKQIYASAQYQHPLNVDPSAANVLLINATTTANGFSDYQRRNDHVYTQQLTYDGNVTATIFISTGGLATEILCANGDTTNLNGFKSQNFPQDVGSSVKYIKLCRFGAYASYSSLKEPTMLYCGSGVNKYEELWMTVGYYQDNQGRIDLLSQIIYGSPVVSDMLTNQIVDTLPSDFTTKDDLKPNLQYNTETITNAPFQINPAENTGYAYGLRIARSAAQGNIGIYLRTNAIATTGTIVNQWQIYTSNANLGLKICLSADADNTNRELLISADGNTLTFNGSVIAGTGATNGATNGQVNYSAGNPILRSVKSEDTTGRFYCDGAKVYWRAKLITLGSVPQ